MPPGFSYQKGKSWAPATALRMEGMEEEREALASEQPLRVSAGSRGVGGAGVLLVKVGDFAKAETSSRTRSMPDLFRSPEQTPQHCTEFYQKPSLPH